MGAVAQSAMMCGIGGSIVGAAFGNFVVEVMDCAEVGVDPENYGTAICASSAYGGISGTLAGSIFAPKEQETKEQ